MQKAKTQLKGQKFIGTWKLGSGNSCRGFTLIELLVVIAIIGILATLVMANVVGVRARARDGQRKSDLSQIRIALETYRADNNGYPATQNDLYSGGGCDKSFSSGSSIYVAKMPCDPVDGTPYLYSSQTGTEYNLTACLENKNDNQATGPNDTGGCTNGTRPYTVQNP